MRLTRPIRGLAAALAVAALLAAGCGSADGDGAPVVDPDYDPAAAAADDAAAAAAATTVPTTIPDTAPTTTYPPPGEKPEVVVPAEIPTELVITDLIAGEGPAAEFGDTVAVHYVGVRSVDGFEFDSNYGDGQQPFRLTLGAGGVIQGWDQGLIGAKAGMRRQLDIPANLAYGDTDQGDIRPGDALTFVIDVVAVEKRPVITAPPMADPAECPATDGTEAKQQEFTEMQPFCIDVTKIYTAAVVTNFGEFTITLDPGQAPQTVNNFVTLARYHYFDDTQCHRVLTDFVVQCGDPRGDGSGGPGYAIPDELPLPGQYELGSIAMANAGPGTAGSQFFIVSGDRGTLLPPKYSLFGQVTEGFDPVVTELNTLENPDGVDGTPPLETITIESVTITES